jgi:hypothetical protein
MAKSHERGRLTDEEYGEFATQTLAFDRKEATFTEKQCLDWVRAMAPPKPEPEVPEIDDADGEGDGGFGGKRLRRQYTHSTRRTGAAAAKPQPVKSPGPKGEKPVATRAHQ